MDSARKSRSFTVSVQLMGLLCFGVALGVIAVFSAGNFHGEAAFLPTLGISLGLLGASAGIGAFFGFLFGVPKFREPLGDGSESLENALGKGRGFELIPNTNLGQVTDWLTKVLLGAGLAQLGAIVDAGHEVGRSYATAVDGAHNSAIFGESIVIAGVTTAFILEYLWTTSRLPEVWASDRSGLS